jgi:hypothetical protein
VSKGILGKLGRRVWGGSVTGSCEHGDEPSGCGATELVVCGLNPTDSEGVSTVVNCMALTGNLEIL